MRTNIKEPSIVLLLVLFIGCLVLSTSASNANCSEQKGSIDLAPGAHIKLAQWNASRFNFIYWRFTGGSFLFFKLLIMPESEYTAFSAGETYINYYEGYFEEGEVYSFMVPFDDIWVIAIWNTSYTTYTVSWEVGLAGAPASTIITTKNITTTKTTTVKPKTVTETIIETTTEKTMHEFTAASVFTFTIFAILVGAIKRKQT